MVNKDVYIKTIKIIIIIIIIITIAITTTLCPQKTKPANFWHNFI